MKLLIVLSLIAYGYAAKLDRTYLPPASASSAGGSPGSLTAPGQDSNFGQQAPGFRGSQPQPGRGSFNQQSGAQISGPAFGQSPSQAPGFGQPSTSYGQPGSNQGGFGRPSGQSSFGQAGSNQPSSASQPSGVQPVGLGVQPSGFSQPQFGQSGPRNQGAFGQSQQPERPQAAADRNAEILRYNNENDGETFAYDFETSNGISAEESGVATNGVQAQGGYSYTGDDGQFYKITYTADENGYVPQGEHLPTPPPIPEEILKSIEENARAAASGTQEGAYNPDEDDSPQQSYQGQQKFRDSNSFGPSGPAGQPQRPQGQGSNQQYNQPQGFKQGSNGPAFSSQGQQGFPGQSRPQGQNGAQSNDQSGYDYSRPQNQGGQPNGNANFIPSGPSKSPGAQNIRKTYQQGQNQPSQTESFGPSRSSQGQYQAPQYNQPQRPSGNQGFVATGPQFNQGSQGPSKLTQQPGNQGSVSQYNQNQGSAPSGPQTNQGFAPNRSSQNQQGFPASQASQGQGGQQTQSQRGQGNLGSQNQDGYEYNRPQGAFNSGNQGLFRPQSQGPTGGSQGLPGSQGQAGFRGTSEPNRPGSPQGPSPARISSFPGSNANRPGAGTQGQQGFPGAQTSQFPGSRGQSSQGQQPQRPGSQSYNPLANQTFNQQKQESFEGPRQPPSFSSEEGYKY